MRSRGDRLVLPDLPLLLVRAQSCTYIYTYWIRIRVPVISFYPPPRHTAVPEHTSPRPMDVDLGN